MMGCGCNMFNVDGNFAGLLSGDAALSRRAESKLGRA